MAWTDELWKGRVIDATDTDHRNVQMAEAQEVCPDPLEGYHSPCGYPSAAQPDTFVNAEWFGLFAIHEACVDADRLRPRDAWFRLQLLWHDGGCLGHRGKFSDSPHGQAAGFDADAWPSCAGAIRARRKHYEALPWENHTAIGGVAGYSIGGAAGRALFECDFQLEVCKCMSIVEYACPRLKCMLMTSSWSYCLSTVCAPV